MSGGSGILSAANWFEGQSILDENHAVFPALFLYSFLASVGDSVWDEVDLCKNACCEPDHFCIISSLFRVEVYDKQNDGLNSE